MDEKLWNKVLKAKKDLPPQAFGLLAKYKARASFARGLRNTSNEDLSLESSEAYFVFLKLSLAFTALELLDAATGHSKSLVIHNIGISKRLATGKLNKLLDQILESTPTRERQRVERALDSLKIGGTELAQNNLLGFLELCRHLMFHGAFTPSGSGLSKSPVNRQLLLEFSSDALTAGDAFLEKWLAKKVAKGPKK